MKTILVDMDSVLTDFHKRQHEIMIERGFTDYPKPEDRDFFYDRDSSWMSEELKKEGTKVIGEKGFFESFEPIEGGIEAVKEMLDLGLNVRICTSPYFTNPTGFQAKADWIQKHFDVWFLKRLVITNDKTLVKGDFLIDDRPDFPDGKSYKPEWKHLVFEQKYNEGLFPKEDYINWKNWKEVLRNHGVDI